MPCYPLTLVIAALLIVASPAAGQAAPPRIDPSAAINSLRAYLAQNGRAASVGERLTHRYEHSVVGSDGCSLQLRTARSSEIISDVSEYSLPLQELSPDVVGAADTVMVLPFVRLVTTTGEETIEEHSVSTYREENPRTTDRKLSEMSLVLTDLVTANEAARFLAQAITACDGQPRSPQGVALAAARQAKWKEEHEARFGKPLTAEEKASVLEACRGRVREKLKAPSTARWDEDPAVLVAADPPGASVLGSVESQNGFGGFGKVSYMCTFERFGKQYVPKDVFVHSSR
jgi:hypothetical protein